MTTPLFLRRTSLVNSWARVRRSVHPALEGVRPNHLNATFSYHRITASYSVCARLSCIGIESTFSVSGRFTSGNRCTSSSPTTRSGVVPVQEFQTVSKSNEGVTVIYNNAAISGSANDANDAKSKESGIELTTVGTYISAVSELSKFRLSALVVATTSAGFLAAGGPISWPTLLCCCTGTALCSSSASTFNQVFEMDRDSKMKRTRNRPLPSGIFSPGSAVALGTFTGVSGGALLALGTDSVTALLGVGNIALYSGLYTYLKPRHEINTWVGAVVGAIPPIMGWTAAGGSPFDIEALLLGGMLYLWQFPHFFALSWMHRVDYARGGFSMVPVNDENGDRTAALITNYAWYLSAIPVVSTMAGSTSSMFAIEGIALNAYAIHVARKFNQDRTNSNARKVFLTSLWYLPCLMTLFIIHSKTWDDNNEVKDGDLRSTLKDTIQSIRKKGKEMCIHEFATFSSSDQNGGSCPLVVGKEKAEAVTANSIKAAAVISAAAVDRSGSK
mmetsp:Transcript_50834/g.75339  ORF Transcript_50834/g.75339 Transcript_50834/m.75339 type:complete len:501 (+) Transcript_50834:75-1577(+)|eukprot:CAMPEP_0195521124 /NCGR_PEP_ID=MMETSP0794_2-20130614/18031_1 /TAXON_ID=515487 /ORGANISM="Stephanopyxis turris, Strain CCMP 815" /LENGTH=500 /DNA_ID=CAMNT_0040650607 /DNA_START=71 /DNA_END=1573 /DNA_ORIENTATION=+